MARLIRSLKNVWQETGRSKSNPHGGIWRLLWLMVRVVIFAYAGLGTMLFLFQSRLLYFPDRELSATPQDAGLPFEEVLLTAADGVKIHAWFVPADASRGAVLFCHGNAGNISNRLYTLSFFRRLGMDTLIFDYRGYGRSEGSPSEAGTYLDAEAAWKYLTRRRQVPPERIVVFGRSLGGAVAARIARDHGPAALIVESAFTSIPDLAARMYPVFPVRMLCRFSYNTLEYTKHARCATLVVHSRDDEMIPYSHGRQIFEAANQPKEFLDISGGHNEGFVNCSQLHEETFDRFIREHLARRHEGP